MTEEPAFDDLALRYFEDALDEAGRIRLQQSLREDDELRTRFTDLAMQRVALAQLLPPASGSTPAQPQRRWSRPTRAVLTLAVGVAFLVLTAGLVNRYWSPQSGPGRPASAGPDLPRIERASGTVTIGHDDGWRPVDSGVGLIRGEAIRTGPEAQAILAWPDDRTRIVLAPVTTLRLLDGDSGTRLALEDGRITVTAASRATGNVLRIRTATARAEVLGTRFALSHSDGATRLAVSEGTVAFSARDGGRRHLVGAGGVMVIADGSGYRIVDDCEGAAEGILRTPVTDADSTATIEAVPGIVGGALRFRGNLDATGSDTYALLLLRPPTPWDAGDSEGLAFWLEVEDEGTAWLEILARPGGDDRSWERFATELRVVAGWQQIHLPWADVTRRAWQPVGAPESAALDPSEIHGINVTLAQEQQVVFSIDQLAFYWRHEPAP